MITLELTLKFLQFSHFLIEEAVTLKLSLKGSIKSCLFLIKYSVKLNFIITINNKKIVNRKIDVKLLYQTEIMKK